MPSLPKPQNVRINEKDTNQTIIKLKDMNKKSEEYISKLAP